MARVLRSLPVVGVPSSGKIASSIPERTDYTKEGKQMRKLVVVTFMSLDGFYEGPGKDVTALPIDTSPYDA